MSSWMERSVWHRLQTVEFFQTLFWKQVNMKKYFKVTPVFHSQAAANWITLTLLINRNNTWKKESGNQQLWATAWLSMLELFVINPCISHPVSYPLPSLHPTPPPPTVMASQLRGNYNVHALFLIALLTLSSLFWLLVMHLAFSADTHTHTCNIDSCSSCLALWLTPGIVLCTLQVVGYRMKAHNFSSLRISNWDFFGVICF